MWAPETGLSDFLWAVSAFEPATDPTATDVMASAEIRPKGAMVLMSPFLGPMMRRTFARRPAQLSSGLAVARARREGASS